MFANVGMCACVYVCVYAIVHFMTILIVPCLNISFTVPFIWGVQMVFSSCFAIYNYHSKNKALSTEWF